MLRLARMLFFLGMIFAATLVMSPWRFEGKSLQGHMEHVVERTGTGAIVQQLKNTFESQTDKLRHKIPEAFNTARRKLAMWINPAPSKAPKEQN